MPVTFVNNNKYAVIPGSPMEPSWPEGPIWPTGPRLPIGRAGAGEPGCPLGAPLLTAGPAFITSHQLSQYLNHHSC